MSCVSSSKLVLPLEMGTSAAGPCMVYEIVQKDELCVDNGVTSCEPGLDDV